MTKRIRLVVLAHCVVTVFLIGMPTAHAIQCRAARPSDQQGRWWAWRLIDGQKCWYEGRAMISKSSLQWSARHSVKAESPATPISVLTETPNYLLDSRASIPDDGDSFESLWRARAINN
jgi:hypothetical protein